jgi:hypothetical protein
MPNADANFCKGDLHPEFEGKSIRFHQFFFCFDRLTLASARSVQCGYFPATVCPTPWIAHSLMTGDAEEPGVFVFATARVIQEIFE